MHRHYKTGALILQAYFYTEDVFNYNYGQAKCAVGEYNVAEEAFNNVQSEAMRSTYTYVSNLAKCCMFFYFCP